MARSGAVARRLARRRHTTLETVVDEVWRRYGPHVIRLGADVAIATRHDGLPPLSTGSVGLDLSVGGLPRGRVAEYAGVEGAGVETLAVVALAACQRRGGLAVLVDTDGGADPDALVAAGVDVSRLALVCPTTTAEAWGALVALARGGAPDLLVLMSWPGLLALPDAGRGAGDGVGLGLLHRRLARLRIALHGRPTAALLVNRPVRGLPRDVPPHAWRTVGEEAVAQAATLRVALAPEGLRYSPHGDIAALRSRAMIVKHRGLPRTLHIPLSIAPDGALDGAAELVALGLMVSCLAETPLGLALGDVPLGRSPARAAQAIARDADLATELERRIRAAWPCGGGRADAEAARMKVAGL